MSDAAGVAEYTRLVNDHSRSVYRYVMRRLSDWSSCEDVVSETFLIAWRRRDRLPPRDRELAWLYAIAFRVISNQRRSRDRRNRLIVRMAQERKGIDYQATDDTFDVESVMKVVKYLRIDDRVLLEHLYWERLTYREIAVVLGISVNAVGIRINRAKRNLRSLLDLKGDSDLPSKILDRKTEG
jgi:RNA polymerase sigma-70 factor (ECF subfamily)